MIYCQYCGVELEDNANFCSLCGEPINKNNYVMPDNLNVGNHQRNKQTTYQHLSHWQQRKVFLEIAGLIVFSGMLISTIINLLDDRAINWSIIVIAAGIMLFVNFSLILFFYHKLLLLFILSFLTSVVFISIINGFTDHYGSIVQLGIPAIFLSGYAIVFVLIALIKKMKQKGLNLIAFSMIASGLLCLCIDGCISVYSRNSIELSWSLIVMTAAFIISALLFYLHGRLKKATDLKRFFHI